MKITKNLSKKNIAILASLAVLTGSSSVFASPMTYRIPDLKSKTAVKTTNPQSISNLIKNFNAAKAQAASKTPATNTKSPVTAPKTQAPVQQAPVTAPSTSTGTTNTATNSVMAYENKVLELVNVERQKAGLKPLAMDESLRNVARKKSEDMQAKKYFSHTSPTYGSPFDMMKQFGITYKSAGENIAMGQKTPEEVVTAWMNSPGHRANILKTSFTHLGVGYVASGNYWTQMFIGK